VAYERYAIAHDFILEVNAMNDPTRYQLRLRGHAQELLAGMCEELNSTPKDVILDALAVFRYAIGAMKQGQQFGAYDPANEKFTAIITPSLQTYSERHSRSGARSASQA
jgi:hypothetical protein